MDGRTEGRMVYRTGGSADGQAWSSSSSILAMCMYVYRRRLFFLLHHISLSFYCMSVCLSCVFSRFAHDRCLFYYESLVSSLSNDEGGGVGVIMELK